MTVETRLAPSAATAGRGGHANDSADYLTRPSSARGEEELAERVGRALCRTSPGRRLCDRAGRGPGRARGCCRSALGALVTRVIEPAWGIGAADERVNVWLAAHRTSPRTEASLLGSIVAGGVVLPILAGSIALVFAALRKWRLAAFIVFALAGEAAIYRATTLVIHAHRPRVVRLENLPVNASYPSGHTAAAVAVYGGLALLLTSRVTNRVARASAWAAVVAPGGVRRDLAHVSRNAPSARRCRRHRRGRRRARRRGVRVPDGRRRCRVAAPELSRTGRG